jgi:hypothetical protein
MCSCFQGAASSREGAGSTLDSESACASDVPISDSEAGSLGTVGSAAPPVARPGPILLATPCKDIISGQGHVDSIAACASLRLIVTSNDTRHSLNFFSYLPDGTCTPAGTLGRHGTDPLEFDFDASGRLAFTVPPPPAVPTLLVTDGGNNRVQPRRRWTWLPGSARCFLGLLGRPWTLRHPTGVAASPRHIAMTTIADATVHLFDSTTRARLWSVRDRGLKGLLHLQASVPFLRKGCGCRLTLDGQGVAVAGRLDMSCLTIRSVRDGGVVECLGCPALQPWDMEECGGVGGGEGEGSGWVISNNGALGWACPPASGPDPRDAVALCSVTRHPQQSELKGGLALAWAPGLGLLREGVDCVQVCPTALPCMHSLQGAGILLRSYDSA